jgi:hypothetical protein
MSGTNIDISTITAVLAFTVPAVGAFIAFQQYRIARDKRRSDLYDRRIKIFRATVEFLYRSCYDEQPNHEFINKFVLDTAESEFLFGSEIPSRLNELLIEGYNRLQTPEDDIALSNRSKDFTCIYEEVVNSFRPYLELKER